ncbi:unannotated protein [freshwater metagenome]|jgi:hypothetical protein|uniref:Unannotated protein n=1 Tax=freshwater metagenome TaxID=449393 RepID=A0A6J7KLV6_9ZZZZ
MQVAYVVVLLRAKRHATDNNTPYDFAITSKLDKTFIPLGFTIHKITIWELT